MLLDCVGTPKGRLCIRAHHVDKNAQLAFADLTKAYNNNVSVQMEITTLRSDLTTLRLDGSWKRSCESFLTEWAHKILNLEEIQNFPVPDNEKRQWLDATVQSHKELEEAVRQALIIETFNARTSGRSPGNNHMAWGAYYDLILSIAKATDNANKKSSKQRQMYASNVDYNNRPPRPDGRGGRPPNTTYEGEDQVMEKHFTFSTPDWWKLTQDQRDTMDQFRRERRVAAEARWSTPEAPATVVPAQITIASESVAPSVTPSVLSTADSEAIVLGNTLRDILSNSAVRKSADSNYK